MASGVLTRELLVQPAPVAARECASAYLERVLDKAARLQHAGVARGRRHPVSAKREPVHDFRVALRRLRAWLRAWRPELHDTVRRKTERRFRAIASAASRARDLEVARATMRTSYGRTSAVVKAGAEWLWAEANAEHDIAVRELALGLLRELGPAAARLTEELARPPAAPGLAPRAATVLAGQLGAHVLALPVQLRKIRNPAQVAPAHDARIALRRFRYALDGIAGLTPDVETAAAWLADLQDRLGELHDAHVLDAQLTGLLEPVAAAAAGPEGPPVAELRALRTQVRRRIAHEFKLAKRAMASPDRRRAMDAARRVVRELTEIGVSTNA